MLDVNRDTGDRMKRYVAVWCGEATMPLDEIVKKIDGGYLCGECDNRSSAFPGFIGDLEDMIVHLKNAHTLQTRESMLACRRAKRHV